MTTAPVGLPLEAELLETRAPGLECLPEAAAAKELFYPMAGAAWAARRRAYPLLEFLLEEVEAAVQSDRMAEEQGDRAQAKVAQAKHLVLHPAPSAQ